MSASHPISRRAKVALSILAIALAAGIGARLAFGGSGPDEDDAPAPAAQAKLNGPPDGPKSIWLTKEEAQALDLKTTEAAGTTAGETLPLHGAVLDPFVFMDLDTRRRSAAAAAQAAQSADAAAQAELARVAVLHASDRGASDKALQDARRGADDAKAALAAAAGEARKADAAWRQTGLDSVEGLADFRRALVRLDIPMGTPAPSPAPRVLAGTSPGVKGSIPLRVLGLAPGGSPLTGGLALLAVAPGADLRPGVPVDTALSGARENRVVVPREAVIWSGATPQVFVEVAEDCYEPRAVGIAFTTDAGIVLSGGIAKGAKVVTQGALALQGEYARLAQGTEIGAGGV